MFRKRYLSINVIIVLLIIVGVIIATKKVVAIRHERSQMIEACRQTLSSSTFLSDRPGYTRYTCDGNVYYGYLQYKGIKTSTLSAIIYFHDGTNDLWCDMQYDGAIWVVNGTGSTLAAPCL